MAKGEPLRSFNTGLAGLDFKNEDGTSRAKILRNSKVGDQLKLVREPNNVKDPNAVKVCLMSGEQVGYLYADEAAEIAPRLDKDSPVNCEIVELNVQGSLWFKKATKCRLKLTKHSMK